MKSHLRRIAYVVAVLLLASSCGESSLLTAPVTIGTLTDEPYVDYQDRLTNQRSGFDVDLYRWLGLNAPQPFTPTEVTLNIEDRENQLRNGQVKLVVGSYSIADFREPLIDFAGPYLVTQQGILTRKDQDLGIRSPEDLRGKNVCAQAGSTSVRQLQDLGVSPTQPQGLGECIELLRMGRVQVVSTDQLLLLGWARIYPSLEVPTNIKFGALERWGIGLPPESGTKSCELLSGLIQRFIVSKAWDDTFRANFGADTDPLPYRPDPYKLRPCVTDEDRPVSSG